MKWLYLDRLSSITSSTSYPFDLGNPTIKSIDISSCITFGMGRGCNNPTGLVALYFCLWQFHIMPPSLSHLFHSYPIKIIHHSPHRAKAPDWPPVGVRWHFAHTLFTHLRTAWFNPSSSSHIGIDTMLNSYHSPFWTTHLLPHYHPCIVPHLEFIPH